MTHSEAPVSVVIPTLGRIEPLRACLDSIAEPSTAPTEVLVVDQSEGAEVEQLVAELGGIRLRRVPCSERGVGRATNLGLREAKHEAVLVTHDDCTVAPDWVLVGSALAQRYPRTAITGRVLPAGDSAQIPSTNEQSEPRDFTGRLSVSALYPNNMVLSRSLALELGGFDDRVLFAEDNDFCFRWLRRGYGLRFEPSLVTWHHDWRGRDDLETMYLRYAKGQGLLYAKHLRRRDLAILPFLTRDLRHALLGRVRPRDPFDYRTGLGRGLLPGLREGWREFADGGSA